MMQSNSKEDTPAYRLYVLNDKQPPKIGRLSLRQMFFECTFTPGWNFIIKTYILFLTGDL